MSNTIRIVNMSYSPAAVPQFTDVVDVAEDRSVSLKTVVADDVRPLTELPARGIAALVDGTPVGDDVQERTATVTLTAGDLVDGARNLIIVSGASAGVTVTLPLTTTMAADTEVWFYASDVTNPVAVDDNAADTIDGGAGPVALASVGTMLRLKNDGVSDWDNIDT